ncbi:MAG: AsmA-like C-terminal region-containing protein [Bacteroidia bacterium]
MKKVLIIIGIVFALLLGAAVVLPLIFKDKIVALVKEEANKNLNAKVNFGDFGLSLISSFPDFRICMEDLSVAGINEFEGDTLAFIKELNLDVDIMSVINGKEIGINAIILDAPRINAHVLKGGKANWDITKPSADTVAAAPAEPSTFSLKLKKLKISDGDIIYNDEDGNIFASVKDLDLTLKGDMTQDNTSLDTEAEIAALEVVMDGVKYLSKTNTELKAVIDADMKNSKYTFTENELRLNNLFLGFDGWVAMPTEDIDMDIKFNAKKTDFKNILSLIPAVYAKDFDKVKTEGKLALDGFAKGRYNEKMLPAFGLKILVENAMFKYPDLPKQVDNINIDVKINNPGVDADLTVIDISKFKFTIAENPVDMKFLIKTPVSDPDIDGKIAGKIDLSSVKDVMPLDEGAELNGKIAADIVLKGKKSSIDNERYSEFDAKGEFTAQDMKYTSKDLPQAVDLKYAQLKFSPAFVELTSLDAKIGKSDFKANGKIENFLDYFFAENGLLRGNFNLNSNMIDLNEFMSGEEEAAATPDTASLAVIDVPANIDFTMTTAIGKLLYDNIEMTAVKGKLTIKDKKVALNGLDMNLMDGTMNLAGSYDVSNIKKPLVDFDIAVTNFDVTKTFNTFNTVQTLAPVGKYVKGKFSTNLKFKTELDSKMEPVLNTLTGGGKLSTSKVTLEGFAPVNKVADALKMEKLKKQELNNLNLSYKFENGRVNVEPFDMTFAGFKTKIGGSTGFDQTIDYVMNFEIPRAEFGGQANAVLDNLVSQANSKGAGVNVGEKINVNAMIGGTVTNPTVKTGLKDAANDVMNDLKDRAQEELNKQKEELERKAREEADKLKNQAQQEADKLKQEAEKKKKELEDKARQEAEKKKKEAEKKAKEEAEKKLKGLFK